jgi:hypothetical protein
MHLEQPFKESIREKRASCTWPSNWLRRIGNWRWATGRAARVTMAVGDTVALLECIAKAKARCGLAPEQEDARRAHRELGRLGQERIAHINRIRALLVLHNLRVKYVGGRLWQRWWLGHANELAPRVRAEIERESERLLLAKKQMDMLEAEQRQAVAAGTEPQVAGLAKLRGIAVGS